MFELEVVGKVAVVVGKAVVVVVDMVVVVSVADAERRLGKRTIQRHFEDLTGRRKNTHAMD